MADERKVYKNAGGFWEMSVEVKEFNPAEEIELSAATADAPSLYPHAPKRVQHG